MSDLISRTVIDWARSIPVHDLSDGKGLCRVIFAEDFLKALKALPSAQPEIIRCNDCIYGHLYIDVQNGVTDSWIECRNPEGLNRDVSVDGYCSASIRRM